MKEFVERSIEELLAEGWVKVGSKTYCTYWTDGKEVIRVDNPTEDPIKEAYNKGYEDALQAIKINLEHFKKDVWSISLIHDGCSIDTYEGESDCEKLLKENILGSYK